MLLAAGASLFNGICAFTGPLPNASGGLCRVSTNSYSARRHVCVEVMPLNGVDGSHFIDSDLNSLPADVRDMISGLSTEVRNGLAAFVNDRRMHDRLEHRTAKERQAYDGANLVCKLYFDSIKNSQYGDLRLSRKHQDNAEKAHNEYHRNRDHGLMDNGLLRRIASIKQRAEEALLQRKSKIASGSSVTIIRDPNETPVQASVAETLDLIGVKSIIDSTSYDGLRYMDVVVKRDVQEQFPGPSDASGGASKLVVQILPEGHRPSYVSIKTSALCADGWAIITVKPAQWKRLETAYARTAWLAHQLATSGFWHSDIHRPLKKAIALKHLHRSSL